MGRKIIIKNIGRLVTMEPSGVIPNAAVVIDGEVIAWLGPEKNLDEEKITPAEVVDAKGCVVLPGFVECHTHLIHAGSRENEFAQRLQGLSYEEIAKQGGGILSTVNATREASVETLYQLASRRAEEAFTKGITTIEIKTGYGLDVESELKMLEVMRRLKQNHPLTIVGTFLGAHTIPKEYKTKRAAYVGLVIEEMLPKVVETGLIQFVDVFVESVAFSQAEAEKIIKAGEKLGLKARLHVDQLANGEGAAFAARMNAVSADHLDYISEEGIRALSRSGTAAVLLPGASFFLGGKKYPPARRLLESGVAVALSTDYNPGTSPTLDPFFIGTIAATQMPMTVEEILAGFTKVPAKILGLEKECGSLAKGKWADLIFLNCEHESYPFYRFGHQYVRGVMKKGQKV